MKRDLDLLRRLLVVVVESDGAKPLNGSALAGFVESDTRSVNFHLRLLADAGWIATVGKPHYTSQTLKGRDRPCTSLTVILAPLGIISSSTAASNWTAETRA